MGQPSQRVKQSGSATSDTVVPAAIKDKKPGVDVRELGVEFQCTADCEAVALAREVSAANSATKFKLTLWDSDSRKAVAQTPGST